MPAVPENAALDWLPPEACPFGSAGRAALLLAFAEVGCFGSDWSSADYSQESRGPRPPGRGRELTPGRDTARGLAATAGAFALWGFIPLYWKLIADLPATEVLAHRIAWSLPCLLVLLAVRGRGGALGRFGRLDQSQGPPGAGA